MYLSISIVLLAIFVCLLAGRYRKKRAINKVCSMTPEEKCELLNSLIEPFGYGYDLCQDIFFSRNDAWQREFGYTAFYDRMAPHLNMVFDCEPVYFNYQNKTWLIEFWKGQYGINTGAEIGIYHADRILSSKEYKTTLFKCADDQEMLPAALCLAKDGCPIATISKRTWWLTAFCMGQFSKPSELYMNIVLTFPNCEMLQNFLEALLKTNIPRQCIQVCNLEVHIQFGGHIQKHYGCLARFFRCWALFLDRFFCRLYLHITRCFCLALDRLLFLYFLLPGAFRHTVRICRCKRKMHRCKKKCH